MSADSKSCREFIDELASGAPTPGGGGAAALCGAIGTALGNMVSALTIGKKKYADVEEMMLKAQERCNALQAEFLELIYKDAACFKPLSEAYRLPKDTPEQKEYRDQQIEKCSVLACEVPVEIMKKCCDAMDIIEFLALKGSELAVSDAGAAMILCRAALESASLNIFINTKNMKDRDEAMSLNAKAREMLYIYVGKAENIAAVVKEKLKF